MAVHEHASALQELGHEVHVLYSRWPDEQVVPRASYRVHFTHQFDCPRINLDIFSFAPALLRLMTRHRFDVIHSNSEVGFFASWIARAGRAVNVSTLHAARLPREAFVQSLRHDPRRAINHIDYHLLRATLERADHVIALGDHSRNVLLGAFGEAWLERSSIIAPGINAAWFSGERQPGDGFRLVTWGRLVPRKGIKDLLAAVARLAPEMPELTLTIFGEGEAAGQYRDFAAQLGLDGRVRFAGLASPTQIQAFALGCHLAVFPSHVESFLRSALEAAAMGLPVVAARVGSMAERLTDGERALLFQPGDVPALCAAIRALYRHPARGAEMGEAARLAAKGLRWPVNAARTVELYRALLDRVGN
jgi:glycogen(starch) synthase